MSNEVPQSVRFTSFNEFYPYYLGEHQNPTCRRLHVIGSTGVLVLLAFGLGVPDWRSLLAMPLCGYGFAWVGHFFFEHNRPATFRYPLWSLMGDWVKYRDVLLRRIPF
jgi:hypothetical protein